jgi:hypothetical protein
LVKARVLISVAGFFLVSGIGCLAGNTSADLTASTSKVDPAKTEVSPNLTGRYRSQWGNTLEITKKGGHLNYYMSVSEGNGDRVGEATGIFVLHGNKAVCPSSDDTGGKFEFTIANDKITVVDKGECFASGVHGDGVYVKQRKHANKQK